MFSTSILIALAAISFPGIKIKTEATGISKQETVALKGMLSLMVFLHHFSGWFANPDPILYFFSHCGSFMVSVFFFLSGYGISKSKTAEKQTFKDLILKILKLFIPFWIIDALCLVMYYSLEVPLPTEVNLKIILLSIINVAEIVSFSWFLSTITVIYILYFLTKKIEKINHILLLFAVLIILSFFVPELWLTYFAFPIGLLISKEELFFRFLSKIKYGMIMAGIVVMILLAIMLKYFGETLPDNKIAGNVADVLSGTLFAVFIYMLTNKIHIGNKVLSFIGEISYEIYLLHGLGIFFSSKFFTFEKPYAFFLVALVFTLVTSFIVNRICKKIFKMLPTGKK